MTSEQEFHAAVIPKRHYRGPDLITSRALARIKEERNRLALERIEAMLADDIKLAMEWLRIERRRVA